MSDNLLSGPLPPIPAGCALVELDVSANGPPLGPTAVNPGITVGLLLMCARLYRSTHACFPLNL